MSGKRFKVPKDMADATDYRVELHPTFTDDRDQHVLDKVLKDTSGLTLGTTVAMLGSWSDVKMEIQMPVPRERPWNQQPIVLVYPDDWHVRHQSPDPPPPKSAEPDGEAREGWKRTSSTSYAFGERRYPVYREPDEGNWVASWWDMEGTHAELWKAQEWVEELESERLEIEAMTAVEAEQGAEYLVFYFRGVPKDGPLIVNGRRLEHNAVMRLDADEVVGLAAHFNVALVNRDAGPPNLWLEDKQGRFGQR